MAAVLAPLEEVERIVETADGYVVVANVNSSGQAVIGGATPAVEKVIERSRRPGARRSGCRSAMRSTRRSWLRRARR